MSPPAAHGTPETPLAVKSTPSLPKGFHIHRNGYEARVTSMGGALRSLRHQGRDLVVSFEEDSRIPDYRGVICAPWPNRLADGRYRYGESLYEVPLTEPGRGTALHGFLYDRVWDLEDYSPAAVELSCTVEPTAGYPFQLRLAVRYEVSHRGLRCSVRAVNTGRETAPYGVCPHPYLLAGPAPLDEWFVTIPAAEFLEVTPDRLLPIAVHPVAGHAFDFRDGRVLGNTTIDHAFTGIIREFGGRAAVRAFDPSGTGVELSWGPEWPWLQIHTADKPLKPDRLGLAVEPMTCPPDAFNSGTDLIHLAPGRTHTASWTIRALSR